MFFMLLFQSLFASLSKTSLDRLQLVQNAAARLVTTSFETSNVTPLQISLCWLPIKFQIQFKPLVFIFRPLHGEAYLYRD